jgi:hypothetical protein
MVQSLREWIAYYMTESEFNKILFIVQKKYSNTCSLFDYSIATINYRE